MCFSTEVVKCFKETHSGVNIILLMTKFTVCPKSVTEKAYIRSVWFLYHLTVIKPMEKCFVK